LLPKRIAQEMTLRMGVDRLSALTTSIDCVRRGGTVSISGVYGGTADPLPMMDLFDKQVQLRMGQCNVKRWIPEILPLVSADDDPLGTERLTTHALPLAEAPHGYEIFQKKADDCIKVVLKP
jgi:threonine dehydrogenase-like Zn-dependent dehydrogenase